MDQEEYQKYRWFFTKSGKLVIGGKSAEQNDSLLNKFKLKNKDYIVMHTSSPGSPFSIILADIKKISQSDINEAAIFTASFSKAWRSMKKKERVDIFKLSNIYKLSKMKTGTWAVKELLKSISVPLSLVLTIQKERLRAVPEMSVKSKGSILFKILPGKIDKQKMLPMILVLLPHEFSEAEILQAFPPGGVYIKNDK